MLLTPYRFSLKSGEYFTHYNKSLLVVIGLFVAFYVRCIYVITQTKETVVGHFNGTILFKIGDLFRIYSNLFTVIVNVWSIFVNKHLYSVILTLLSDIDKNFIVLGVDKHYERINYKPYLTMCNVYCFYFNLFLKRYFGWVLGQQTNAVLVGCHFCTRQRGDILCGYVLQMNKNELCPFVNNIYKNSQLMTNEIKKKVILKTSKDLQLERLTLLWTIYDAICDGASNQNRLFGLRILTIFCVSFTLCLTQSFFGVSTLIFCKSKILPRITLSWYIAFKKSWYTAQI